MHTSQTDLLLLVLPFIGLLIIVVLRLDERIFAPNPKKSGMRHRQRFANFEGEGDAMADPDGRVGELSQHRRRH